jgi:hypothetical protein
MSAAKHPEYGSIQSSSSDEKHPSDGHYDLDRVASLSYSSHKPLSRNMETPQRTDSIDHPAQAQATLSLDRDGLPSQTYTDSHPQSHHDNSHRRSTWNVLGGARRIGEAYERFDPRNASEQHLAFADGDLPKTKVSCQLW